MKFRENVKKNVKNNFFQVMYSYIQQVLQKHLKPHPTEIFRIINNQTTKPSNFPTVRVNQKYLNSSNDSWQMKRGRGVWAGPANKRTLLGWVKAVPCGKAMARIAVSNNRRTAIVRNSQKFDSIKKWLASGDDTRCKQLDRSANRALPTVE